MTFEIEIKAANGSLLTAAVVDEAKLLESLDNIERLIRLAGWKDALLTLTKSLLENGGAT